MKQEPPQAWKFQRPGKLAWSRNPWHVCLEKQTKPWSLGGLSTSLSPGTPTMRARHTGEPESHLHGGACLGAGRDVTQKHTWVSTLCGFHGDAEWAAPSWGLRLDQGCRVKEDLVFPQIAQGPWTAPNPMEGV